MSSYKHCFTLFVIFFHWEVWALRSSSDFFNKVQEKTLQNSPEIIQLRSQLRQKDSLVWTSISRWFPQISAQFSQTKSKDYSLLYYGTLGSLANSLTPTEVQTMGWALQLQLPLYRRSIHIGVSTSLIEREVLKSKLELKEKEIEWKLRQLFGIYLISTFQLLTLEKSVEVSKKQFQEIQTRWKLGMRTKVDLLRAETQYFLLQSEMIASGADQETAKGELLNYIGGAESDRASFFRALELSEENEILSFIEDFSQVDLSNLTIYFDMNDELLNQRLAIHSPLIKNLRLEENFSNKKSYLLTAEHWPELILQASLSKRGTDWQKAFENEQRSSSIGLVLNIPLFSGGSLFSTQIEQSEVQKSVEIRMRSDIYKFENDVASLLKKVKALLKMRDSRKKAFEQAQELERLSQRAFELGKATMVELLESQNQFLKAKNSLAQSKVDLAVSVRRLEWNLGVSKN